MRLVAISDTHNRHRDLALPKGDLLVHAGDATQDGTLPEIEDFLDWFGAQPHRHKVFVAGNHDFLCDQIPEAFEPLIVGFPVILPAGVTYLMDSGVVFEGLSIYGSPWQSDARKWGFWLERGPAMAAKRALIPPVDILVTHAPPQGIMDVGVATKHYEDAHFGCPDLLDAVRRTRPKVHVFGHVHRCYGTMEQDGVRFVNAVNSPSQSHPLNDPIVLDL